MCTWFKLFFPQAPSSGRIQKPKVVFIMINRLIKFLHASSYLKPSRDLEFNWGPRKIKYKLKNIISTNNFGSF